VSWDGGRANDDGFGGREGDGHSGSGNFRPVKCGERVQFCPSPAQSQKKKKQIAKKRDAKIVPKIAKKRQAEAKWLVPTKPCRPHT
jgi:hypothetical protein